MEGVLQIHGHVDVAEEVTQGGFDCHMVNLAIGHCEGGRDVATEESCKVSAVVSASLTAAIKQVSASVADVRCSVSDAIAATLA